MFCPGYNNGSFGNKVSGHKILMKLQLPLLTNMKKLESRKPTCITNNTTEIIVWRNTNKDKK